MYAILRLFFSYSLTYTFVIEIGNLGSFQWNNIKSFMEYTRLGKSGLKISRIGLGMMSYGSKSWRPWVLEEEEGLKHVKRALELGLSLIHI